MQQIEVKKTVSAWQWNGEESNLPKGFHLCQPEVHYSETRNLIYFMYADLRATQWLSSQPLPAKPEGENTLRGCIEVTLTNGEKYWRESLPFSLWSVKSEATASGDHSAKFLDRENADEYRAFIDFACAEGWALPKDGVLALPPRLEYREVNGAYGRGYRPYYLKPSDWLVIDGPKITVLSNEDFRKTILQ